MQIFKNWHFNLMPKYSMDYFLKKINDLGKKASVRVNKKK
jgi:hypothetical protein